MAKETTLDKLRPQEKGKIVLIKGLSNINKRLLDMGATKGTEVVVVKVAPLLDPIEVKIRGYNLSLRKKEAENVVVETE